MNKLSISNNKAVIFKYFNKDIKKLKNKKFLGKKKKIVCNLYIA